jgi:hypothetical protein
MGDSLESMTFDKIVASSPFAKLPPDLLIYKANACYM